MRPLLQGRSKRALGFVDLAGGGGVHPQRAVVVAAVAGALLFASGCRTPSPQGATGGGMKLMGLPPPPLIMPNATIPQPKRPPPFDLAWLDLEEFIPAGATAIQPFGPPTGPLAPEERTRYPSAELCTAPDQSAVLFNDGYKYKQSIVHWLTLKRKDAPITNAVFSTTGAFDAMWSPNSSAFAVTHYVGGNASEVVFVRMSDLERQVLNLQAVLRAYFPARVASAPVFMKAYRWTRDGALIVRGIGRAPDEPHERFGCEVQVSFRPDDAQPTLTYLRGYVFADRK